ncbi:MAG TPA: IPT/TIG domain-containing protein, partial [Terriglobia bacterium]|nr:IPT/TIG domain-containing protein [Terriglobia bacterium]
TIGVKGGVDMASGNSIRIAGVRGMADVGSGGRPKANLTATLSATPVTVAAFSPATVLVAVTGDPLVFALGLSAPVPCQPGDPLPSLVIGEGYPTAFVDHGEVGDIAYPGLPANARIPYGALNNSHVRISLTGLHPEVKIQWPAVVPSASGGSALSLVSQSVSGDTANYLFGTANQAVSDAATEGFTLNLAPSNFLFSGTGSVTGTVRAEAQMFPASGRPGYNHPLQPAGGIAWITLLRCPSAIHVSATMDGAPYSGPLSFQLAGPLNATESSVPKSYLNAPAGSYTLSYLFGGPGNSVFNGISPAASQNLPEGGTIRFTLTFSTRVCNYALNPPSVSFPAEGGSGTVSVSTDNECSWTASSNSSFVAITGGASGSGSGIVSYSVFSNGSIEPRVGTLTIAGRTFTITQEGLSMDVSPSLLRFTGLAGSGLQTGVLRVLTTRSSIDWNASAAVLTGSNWLTVSPQNGTATSAQPSRVTLAVDFSNLIPGLYQAEVRVASGPASRVVQVQVAVLSPRARLVANPSAFLFIAGEGNNALRSKRLRIFNAGQSILSWTIASSELSGASWLSLSALVGTANPGAASSITLTVNPTGLGAGVYQKKFNVRATGAADAPIPIAVTLLVLPATTPPQGDLAPSGMIFVTQVGGGQVLPQPLVIDNAGGGGALFTLSVSTTSGGNWLKISQGSGSTSLGPVSIDVSADPTGLATGIYGGKIVATFSSGPPQETEVLLVVAPAGSFLLRETPGAGACAAASMDMVTTTIGNGVSQPLSFPRPVLAQLVDNCGSAVDGATVVATIGGLSMVLNGVGGGLYSGSWTPTAEAASVAVTVAALHPSLGSAQRSYTISTSAAAGGVTLPVLGANGVVEGAGFTALRPLAPGAIVSLFGTGLSTESSVATTIPLQRSMSGTSVQIGGEDAPLYFVSPNQINAQVPFTAPVGESVSIVVNANGRLTTPQTYLIAPGQPGVFQAAGTAAVLDSQYRPISAQNPARIGDTLQIFANGLGLVDQPVAT